MRDGAEPGNPAFRRGAQHHKHLVDRLAVTDGLEATSSSTPCGNYAIFADSLSQARSGRISSWPLGLCAMQRDSSYPLGPHEDAGRGAELSRP